MGLQGDGELQEDVGYWLNHHIGNKGGGRGGGYVRWPGQPAPAEPHLPRVAARDLLLMDLMMTPRLASGDGPDSMPASMEGELGRPPA